MFKIPKWEDDVPKSKIDFGKAIKKNKKDKKSILSIPQTNKQSSPKINGNSPVEKIKNKQNQFKTSNSSPKLVQRHQLKTKQNSEQYAAGNKKGKKNKKPVRNIQTQKNNNSNTQSTAAKKGIVKKNKNNIGTGSNRVSNQGTQHAKLQSLETTTALVKKAKKRKHEPNSITSDQNNMEFSKPNKVKKRKLNSNVQDDANQPLEIKKNVINTDSSEAPAIKKVDKKKEKLKKILQIESHRNPINASGNNLRQRMLDRLKAAQFRFLNEKLYTTSGSEAQQLFQTDPEAFRTYHQGYQQQLKKWPVNPLDLIVKRISKMPKSHMVADMGCGEASLSQRLSQTVRSFDLVSNTPAVEACDMARTPLLSDSVDVAVYCLALMGTDLTEYLVEANRVLKVGGHLLIAEVESRFDKVDTFTSEVERLGFKLKNLDKSHQVFFFMEFAKIRPPPVKKAKRPAITLKPCLYKKR